jgi:hypothetical protein
MHILPLSISKVYYFSSILVMPCVAQSVEKCLFKYYVENQLNEQVWKGNLNKKEIPAARSVYYSREPLNTSILSDVPANFVPVCVFLVKTIYGYIYNNLIGSCTIF